MASSSSGDILIRRGTVRGGGGSAPLPYVILSVATGCLPWTSIDVDARLLQTFLSSPTLPFPILSVSGETERFLNSGLLSSLSIK